jgi:flavin reductase (DIM6/NTAB) family NADH-FMN oxidoreductase RutF
MLYSRHFVHPVTLLSVSDGEVENVATMAWVSAVSSNPPLLMVAVSPKRYSHNLVLRAREFAVIVLSSEQKHLATLAGTISGSNTNKWEMPEFSSLKKEPSRIKAPLLKNCLANMECKLVNSVTAGDHTLFIGEVLEMDSEETIDPLILFNRKYLAPGKYIDKYP